FSWSGVRLEQTGLTRARARIVPVGSAVRVDITGEHGEPVLSIDRLGLRPVEQAQLEGPRREQQGPLYRVDWTPVSAGSSEPVRLAVLGGLAASGEGYADLDALER
ncbi:hypothetical protein RKE29_30690, partial [Streptomyces sp. B1866]|uniref:hypothetical protein n=1 Tax=Streptomyces sp. B1866 TaxID=3075431 RepID=UPI00288DF044